MDVQKQEKLKEVEKRTQTWLDIEMDNWTDDSKARWIINRVPELLQLVREQEIELVKYEHVVEAVKNYVQAYRNGASVIELSPKRLNLSLVLYELEESENAIRYTQTE